MPTPKGTKPWNLGSRRREDQKRTMQVLFTYREDNIRLQKTNATLVAALEEIAELFMSGGGQATPLPLGRQVDQAFHITTAALAQARGEGV